MSKRAIVCVTNDLSTDQRVRKTCMTLLENGYEVLETGRLLPNSLDFNPPYAIRRPKHFFNKGAAFYAEYNIRLFLYLLFAQVDLIYSNDLDTLPAAFLASKLRRKKLIYDTHEYFTEVPELVSRPRVQAVWKRIEQMIFPRLEYIITVNDSIAQLYADEYNKKIAVVRNIPAVFMPEKQLNRNDLGLPKNKNILILQGSGINVDRGAEEAVEAMKYLNNYLLLIVGSGDVLPILHEMVERESLQEKVIFKGKMPFEELRQYTAVADLGLALDKDTNLNYRFSLPNKLFDYIHSGTPVLSTELPELKRIIAGHDVGWFIPNHQPQEIAQTIRSIFENKKDLLQKKENCKKASSKLNWENEKKQLLTVIDAAQK